MRLQTDKELSFVAIVEVNKMSKKRNRYGIPFMDYLSAINAVETCRDCTAKDNDGRCCLLSVLSMMRERMS